MAETDVRCPTDVSLLWDAMRCLLRETGRAAEESGVGGWRQWKHLSRSVQRLFHRVRVTRRARPEHVEAYLVRCRKLAARAEAGLADLAAHGVKAWEIVEIEVCIAHAKRQIDRIDRRLLRGGTIPQDEKVFPVFEPHTRWIAKGKAGCPAELGVPVCILEDRHGFVLHHEVMWEGSDADYAAPMAGAAQARFPDLRAVSFDRGFHSPGNRVRLDALPGNNALPKKNYLNRTGRERGRGDAFAALRRQHPAVESAINNLGRRGLDRALARGPEGFARMAALSAVALNIHRIGLLLRRKTRRRRTA